MARFPQVTGGPALPSSRSSRFPERLRDVFWDSRRARPACGRRVFTRGRVSKITREKAGRNKRSRTYPCLVLGAWPAAGSNSARLAARTPPLPLATWFMRQNTTCRRHSITDALGQVKIFSLVVSYLLFGKIFFNTDAIRSASRPVSATAFNWL